MIDAARQTAAGEHTAHSAAATEAFFAAEAARIADCCRLMADRFRDGGTLIAIGDGAQASDARHVAVEFLHPIIVGKSALPALAVTGRGNYEPSLRAIARAPDILLALCGDAADASTRSAIELARRRGLLTLLLCGGRPPRLADIEFGIEAADAMVVQEVSETLYHVLWELVHVAAEASQGGVVAFLSQPGGAPRPADLLDELCRSVREKARDAAALRAAVAAAHGERTVQAARAVARRISAGGRVFACGNGGSATDADDAVADCVTPPVDGWRVLPAIALTGDVGVVTAIANDAGFAQVFARQLLAFGRADDVVLAFSTSGASSNLAAAMAVAKARGLLTIALSGGQGGELARPGAVDFCFTVACDYLPRIQETQATIWHALLGAVQRQLR